jgi:hypothetical protein
VAKIPDINNWREGGFILPHGFRGFSCLCLARTSWRWECGKWASSTHCGQEADRTQPEGTRDNTPLWPTSSSWVLPPEVFRTSQNWGPVFQDMNLWQTISYPNYKRMQVQLLRLLLVHSSDHGTPVELDWFLCSPGHGCG